MGPSTSNLPPVTILGQPQAQLSLSRAIDGVAQEAINEVLNVVKEAQFLHLSISSLLLPLPFKFTAVYAKCTISVRRVLWDDIREVAANCSSPRIIGGDFNMVLTLQERKGYTPPKLESMQEFGDMIVDCGLIDTEFENDYFTWNSDNLWQWLDRVLYSTLWIRYPRLGITPDYFGLVNLQQKLFHLKVYLKAWNKSVFGSVVSAKAKAESEIKICQATFDSYPSDINLMKFNRCNANLTQILAMEEDFWKQKFACKWLVEEERNTQFFHSIVKKKRVHTHIHKIEVEGVSISGQEEVKA
ncbi:hypothetical protein BUALT_Bualt15G0114500 [Buddleja alternifolia]|uniref:Endonuclease/exonuclease/phosphatase domain-containing protein n=1 Tax=Buddleja alternifolia TaxID=168488 RepID=A0AAV6WJM9_9LAMI|nr:hypothetical protein BUALT_Bualt15G0114500 [Buddleja alternifolia]